MYIIVMSRDCKTTSFSKTRSDGFSRSMMTKRCAWWESRPATAKGVCKSHSPPTICCRTLSVACSMPETSGSVHGYRRSEVASQSEGLSRRDGQFMDPLLDDKANLQDAVMYALLATSSSVSEPSAPHLSGHPLATVATVLVPRRRGPKSAKSVARLLNSFELGMPPKSRGSEDRCECERMLSCQVLCDFGVGEFTWSCTTEGRGRSGTFIGT